MGFLSKKPGFDLYQYHKRFGGYKSGVLHALNKNNSHSVATKKAKLVTSGIEATASGGLGKFKDRVTSKKLSKLIESYETSGLLSKHDAAGIRQVFSKELARKDPSSGSWSLFSTPEGISKGRLEKDTFGKRSLKHEIHSTLLHEHDRVTGKRLSSALNSVLGADAEGGSSTTFERIEESEIGRIGDFMKSVPGFTERDQKNVLRILDRALGKKTQTTPTLHPLSTGQVIHKKTAEVGVTPPPPDGIEKAPADAKPKPPIMHTPPLIQGAFVVGAAVAPAWKDRSDKAKNVNVEELNPQVANKTETQTDTTSGDEVKGTPVTSGTSVGEHEASAQKVPGRPTQPISSRASVKARLEKRKAERAIFTQYEQTSTRLSHGSQETPTGEHTPSRRTPDASLNDRFEQRRHDREALNAPAKDKAHDQASQPVRMSFAPHISTAHVSIPKPQTDTGHADRMQHAPDTQAVPEVSVNTVLGSTEQKPGDVPQITNDEIAQVPGTNTNGKTQDSFAKTFISVMQDVFNQGPGPIVTHKNPASTATKDAHASDAPHSFKVYANPAHIYVPPKEAPHAEASAGQQPVEDTVTVSNVSEPFKTVERAPLQVGNNTEHIVTPPPPTSYAVETMATGVPEMEMKEPPVPLTTHIESDMTSGSELPPESIQQPSLENPEVSVQEESPTPTESSTVPTFEERLEKRQQERDALNHATLDTSTEENSAHISGVLAASQEASTPFVYGEQSTLRVPQIYTSDTEAVLRQAADEERGPKNKSNNPVVEFNTNLGSIAIELFVTDMPHTATHFITLAKHGMYTGTKFQRVADNYVIQAGETAGSPNPSTIPKDEPKEPHSNMRGAVSMVSADKNPGGTVFSINVVNNVVLDGRYPVFGRVIAGMDVVDTISKVPVDGNEVPKTPIVIEAVTVSLGK